MHIIPKHHLVDRARHSATLAVGVVLVLCGLALVVARG
jgi:cytochrome b subunit of formate dehydrogenase